MGTWGLLHCTALCRPGYSFSSWVYLFIWEFPLCLLQTLLFYPRSFHLYSIKINTNFLLSLEDTILELETIVKWGCLLIYIFRWFKDPGSHSSMLPPHYLGHVLMLSETVLKLTQLLKWKSSIMGQLFLSLFVRQMTISVVCPTKRNHF